MIEFQFEQSPWEAFLETHKAGSSVSALNLLALLEGEDDDAVEEAFDMIRQKHLSVDIKSLPRSMPSGQAALRLQQEADYIKAGLNPALMEENDPLRLYLEELASIPAFGDERLLAEQAASGDEAAAAMLVNLGLSRVVALAAQHSGYQVFLMDLIQEGSMGLWQGIQDYSGGDYPAARDRWIQNAIAKAIVLQARSSGIGQKMRQALQDYRSIDEKLLMELGRNPFLDEIADQMHITREEAEAVRKMYEDAMLVQQAEKLSQPEQEADEDDMAVEDTAYFQMRQRITELLSQLSEKDAQLLTLRFGLEKGLPMSPEETARQLGLTVQEVAAREAAALAKLRTNS